MVFLPLAEELERLIIESPRMVMSEPLEAAELSLALTVLMISSPIFFEPAAVG